MLVGELGSDREKVDSNGEVRTARGTSPSQRKPRDPDTRQPPCLGNPLSSSNLYSLYLQEHNPHLVAFF